MPETKREPGEKPVKRLTAEDKARLFALAAKATPGQWESCGSMVFRGNGEFVLTDADAAYIAAASPDVIRALLAELGRLRRALQEIADRGEHERFWSVPVIVAWAHAALANPPTEDDEEAYQAHLKAVAAGKEKLKPK